MKNISKNSDNIIKQQTIFKNNGHSISQLLDQKKQNFKNVKVEPLMEINDESSSNGGEG